MFVRTKFDADRNRTRVQIVQSVRDGQKVRQRIVRHVGIATSDLQLDSLRQLARVIMEEIRQSASPQQELIAPKQYADLLEQGKRERPGRLGVDLGECREESRLSVGVREVFGALYTHLGWDRVLGARRMSANRILKELVLARLVQPRSKRGTVLDLSREAGVTLNLDRVYQTLDFLDEDRIESIRQQSCDRARSLFEQPLEVLFFDTTTLYFESEKEDEGDDQGVRFKGYSKDGKPHRTQVLLALLVTTDGLPVGYQVFPGNTYEGHTLTEAIDALRKHYAVETITVVADAGMLSQDNQAHLRERKLPYILGYRLKSGPAALKRKILDPEGFVPWDGSKGLSKSIQRYKVLEHDGSRIIVTYSEKRAHKDQHLRTKAIERLHKKLKRSKKPASLVSRGTARFLEIPDEGTVQLNPDKIAEAARWDGLRAILVHGNEDRDPRDLVGQYRQLWEIEHCFRTNKHDLKIRPIYHWKPRRIRAHLAICYMAFCCLQHLRHRLKALGYPMSPEAIRRELNALQLSILVKKGTQHKFILPSRATAEARRIYRSVSLSWDEAPYPITPVPKKRKASIGS